jgi:hypothetical protein
MTAGELLKEIESFRLALIKHRELFGQSLDEHFPDYPKSNERELEEQSRELLRTVGRLRPFLESLHASWVMVHPMTGVTWDALEAAAGTNQIAQIKGESLDGVIGVLDQIAGRLEGMDPTDTIRVPKSVEEKSNGNWVNQLAIRVKSHPVMSAALLLGAIVIGIGSFTDAIEHISGLVTRMRRRITNPEFTEEFSRLSGKWRLLSLGPQRQILGSLPKDLQLKDGLLWTSTIAGDVWGTCPAPMGFVLAVPGSDTDFIVTTYVDSLVPRRNFQQAGLIVLEDSDNYVRLTMAASNLPWGEGGNKIERVIVQGVSERGGTVGDVQHILGTHVDEQAADRRPKGERAALRIERHGTLWKFSYSFGRWSSSETRFESKFEDGSQANTDTFANGLKPKWVGILAFKGFSPCVSVDQIPSGDTPDSAGVIPVAFERFSIERSR